MINSLVLSFTKIISVVISTCLLFSFGLQTFAQANGNNDYTTSGNKIYKGSQEINFYGLNWFGFEDEDLRIHGSWTRSISDLIEEIKNQGFNAIRVPICSKTLENRPVGFIDTEKNPEYEGLRSLEFLDKFLFDLEQNQLHFILVHHSIDCQEISPLWYNSKFTEQNWIDDLTFMANRYRANSFFAGIDLKNENHSLEGENFPEWGTGKRKLDWRLAAQKAGKAVHETNPNVLIFVGGIENGQEDCSKDDEFLWGENFMPVDCYPVNNMFIPENKLVYSPHIYGPDVYNDIKYFSDTDFPENMPALWEDHFGFLLDDGYSLVPGEFGGKYGLETETGLGSEGDVLFQDKLVQYFIDKNICNFFYWSFNPNSDDTGGLLLDDWTTPVESKIDNIMRIKEHCEDIPEKMTVKKDNVNDVQISETESLENESETKIEKTQSIPSVDLPLDTDLSGISIREFKKPRQQAQVSSFFTLIP